MHEAPSALHWGGPQTPPLHWLVQHSSACVHGAPSGWQAPQVTPQTELTSFTQI
jgi:hypothetical protein